ncbi:SulP family inorganic anion transporter [Paenibacillus xylaniclasticus]|uniref:SulP family inorganic anion transporter n=1 Tax=Paenibacillus xylaniclasticus TaxID=588083 RepID=UPI000FD9CFF7|nr:MULTISPECIES: SulP family inorganic anion transporter [Paenibacillus]GFN31370.1 sodium-independent anion transporter [Paenibacillus curdlanolyticus]
MKLGRFSNYSQVKFRKDLISGLIVGVIAIPLGMAFAIASGVKPEYGIYTTIIAGILVSIFGGSKFQIAGPTGAFIPILLGIVISYGYENLLLAGLLAGILLLLMGLFKLGELIRYIPRPVTIGFTAGIAVTIFSGQISNFLGLTGIKNHEYFIDKMKEIYLHLNTINIYSVIVAAIGLALIIITNKYVPKVPGALVGLIGSSVAATLFFPDQLATIGSAYGDIPNTLPSLQLPKITWDRIERLMGPAFVIAMLGGIESLLSAVVADEMTGTKHNSNRELIGQGIANIVTPLFGGIPATGAIARTATNVKNGAASPVSGIIQGLVVLVVLLLFAPFASNIPLASMAPILMVVAWNMSEMKKFGQILKTRTWDSIIVVIIFLLTVFVDLTTAVGAGILLSMIIFVKKMSDLHVVAKVLPDPTDKHHKVKPHILSKEHDCPQINICTIEGPLFFGSAQGFEQTLRGVVHPDARILILRLGKVPYMDTTGAANLSHIVHTMKAHEGTILVSGLQAQPKYVLRKTGLYDEIGENNFYDHTGDAINYALRHINLNQCAGCKHFAFRECSQLSRTER